MGQGQLCSLEAAEALAVSMFSCSFTLSLQAYMLQHKSLMGIRLEACNCTAGNVSCMYMH